MSGELIGFFHPNLRKFPFLIELNIEGNMICVSKKKNLISFVFSGFFWFKVVMSFSGDDQQKCIYFADLLLLISTAAAVHAPAA